MRKFYSDLRFDPNLSVKGRGKAITDHERSQVETYIDEGLLNRQIARKIKRDRKS